MTDMKFRPIYPPCSKTGEDCPDPVRCAEDGECYRHSMERIAQSLKEMGEQQERERQKLEAAGILTPVLQAEWSDADPPTPGPPLSIRVGIGKSYPAQLIVETHECGHVSAMNCVPAQWAKEDAVKMWSRRIHRLCHECSSKKGQRGLL